MYAEHGAIPDQRCAGIVLAAIFIIAWLNLSNDAFDAATGVDKTKRESVVNLTGGKKGLVLLVANIFLLGGLSLLGCLIPSSGGDMRPAAMLFLAIACGYVYQGPPFRSDLGQINKSYHDTNIQFHNWALYCANFNGEQWNQSLPFLSGSHIKVWESHFASLHSDLLPLLPSTLRCGQSQQVSHQSYLRWSGLWQFALGSRRPSSSSAATFIRLMVTWYGLS